METIKWEAKTGVTHNGEQVPTWVTLVNDKLEMAIKKAAYKYMITEEEVSVCFVAWGQTFKIQLSFK